MFHHLNESNGNGAVALLDSILPPRGTHLQIICARFHLYCSPGKVAARSALL
jgi:hypothetical protein